MADTITVHSQYVPAATPENLDAARADYTEPSTRLDLAESLRLAQMVGAVPKNCWWNALGALARSTAARQAGVLYVEGVMAYSDLQALGFSHGWLERPDGTILDPTVVRTREVADLVARKLWPHYVAVARYPWDEARAWVQRDHMPVTTWRDRRWSAAQFSILIAACGGWDEATPGQILATHHIYKLTRPETLDEASTPTE